MRRISVILLLTTAYCSSVFASSHSTAKTTELHGTALAPEISMTELKKVVSDDLVAQKKAVIIDANSTSSFEKDHVPGAILYRTVEGKLASSLPADKATLIVAYCGGPKCTAWEDAAKEAKAAGYTNIKHLKAGISGWTASNTKK